MRTSTGWLLLISLACLTAADLAHAQPVREKLDKKAEQALRDQIKALEVEYSQYDDDATGFEGAWTFAGTRSLKKNAETEETAFSGNVLFTRTEEGGLSLAGTAYLEGRTTGKFEGDCTPSESGKTLTGSYKATIAGEGEVTFRVQDDGSLRVSMKGRVTGKAVECVGTATRAIDDDQAGVEARLYDLHARLQYSRYPRPEPARYRSPSRKTEVRFTPSVEWDPEGVEAQVIRLIGEAKRSIDLAVFEFALPRVAHALVAASERGVAVRMVYDSREEEQPAIHILKDAEIPLRGDQRSAYMHNKFMVIDGRILWTGSTNLAPGGIYVADNNAVTFHNAEICGIYTTEFEEMFVDGKFGPTSPANTSTAPITVDVGTKVEVYFAPENNAMDRVIQAVRSAKKSIKFLAFAYTSEPLFQAMRERLAAGVEVSGIFESFHAGWANITIGPLHAAGATVRFDTNPDTLHHKVIIIDDKIVLTGSFNFSDGADRSNDENLLVIDNRNIAKTFADEFASLLSTTDPNDPRIATSGMNRGLTDAVESTTEDGH
jgi:phosphatidylserine/phosphatidylglycerophosphate/cardiolipin synthase-like enzyme